jgi:hypothetical protein
MLEPFFKASKRSRWLRKGSRNHRY